MHMVWMDGCIYAMIISIQAETIGRQLAAQI